MAIDDWTSAPSAARPCDLGVAILGTLEKMISEDLSALPTPNGRALAASPLATIGGPQRFRGSTVPKGLKLAEARRLRAAATAEADGLMERFADEIEHLQRRLVAVAALHGRPDQAIDTWARGLEKLKAALGQ